MGLALFFFHYARFTQNELYSDYAIELIEKIQNRIHEDTPTNYKDGLAGIGSTIEYLVQEGFIEADTDAILEDFDNRLFHLNDLPHLSFEEITSRTYYAIWRISGSKGSAKEFLLNTISPKIVSAMEELCTSRNITHPIIPFFRDLVESEILIAPNEYSDIPAWNWLLCENHPYRLGLERHNNFLESISKNIFFELTKLNLGFQNGLAGCAMSLLAELSCDYSWTSLYPNDFISVKNESIPV